jgi:hypothetical protein
MLLLLFHQILGGETRDPRPAIGTQNGRYGRKTPVPAARYSAFPRVVIDVGVTGSISATPTTQPLQTERF